MTEQQIIYFLALVEEQSFSRAAKKLYITQPSFSQFIQKMERQFRVTLFDRSKLPIRLTPEGEVLYEAVCEIRSVHSSLEKKMTDISNLKTGTLCIGTTAQWGSILVGNSIKKFHTLYPGIKIHLLETTSSNLSHSLLQGKCDLAICTGSLNPLKFQWDFIKKEKFYLAMSTENPLTKNLKPYQQTVENIMKHSIKDAHIPKCPLELFDHQRYISLEERKEWESLWKSVGKEAGKIPSPFLEVDHIYTAFSLVLLDVGVSFFSDTFIQYGNHRNHPFYYEIKHLDLEQDVYLAWKKNHSLSRAAIEYRKIVKEELE